MSNSDLAKQVHRRFVDHGWKYRVGGRLRDVTVSDLEKILSDMCSALKDEPNESQIILGRMIMRKTQDVYDVYVFEGEYDG